MNFLSFIQSLNNGIASLIELLPSDLQAKLRPRRQEDIALTTACLHEG
jgi:hypothetical protein